MEQTSLFLWLALAGGGLSYLFGVLFLLNPQVVHKLNQGISFSLMSFDTALMKHNRITGAALLIAGCFILYMAIRFA